MLELGNIENLGLYIDIEEENEEQEIEVKRVPLERDLEIDEIAYFDRTGMKRNKIVKQDKEKYMFYRFDEIQTHIEDYDSGYNIEDVRDNITYEFDYNLEYASERVEFLEELLDENDWVYDLISSNRIIQKEQKKKDSFLGEDQRLDGYFQRMIDYVIHPKFDNEDSENYFKELKDNYEFLRDKTHKTNAEVIEMISFKDEIDLINQGVLTNSRIQRNNLREQSEESVVDLENVNGVIVDPTEFSTDKSKIEYVGKDLEIYEGYWKDMGFTKEGIEYREDIMKVYEESLGILTNQLGHGKSPSEKEKIRQTTIKKLDDIKYVDDDGNERTITAERRFSGLERMYSEIKSDHYRAKEILAVPIAFTQVSPTFTEYDFNTDTWYIDEEGKEVELSKNTISFNDINTYKGLISNYYNLKDRYRVRFHDDMWSILATFEDLVNNTELSIEEKFVLNEIMSDGTRKEIAESYAEEFGKTISFQTLSNWINRTIPRKILNTYLESINEWLYTYKIKGSFKRCSNCNETKILNSMFFRKNSLNRDGFRGQCKKCDGLVT